jgi:hypothetical protein
MCISKDGKAFCIRVETALLLGLLFSRGEVLQISRLKGGGDVVINRTLIVGETSWNSVCGGFQL